MSGNSWANMGQECIKCHINVYPHKQVGGRGLWVGAEPPGVGPRQGRSRCGLGGGERGGGGRGVGRKDRPVVVAWDGELGQPNFHKVFSVRVPRIWTACGSRGLTYCLMT